MKNIRKISGLLLLCIFAITAAAQTDQCITRKSFAVKSGDWLAVTGKYGEIKISSTVEDSLIVCSTVSIRQKDPALLEKSMSMIKTLIEKKKDTLSVRTSFDEEFFTPPYNTSRTGFSVDYAITLPEGINLRINNSLGDVFLDKCDGSVNIRVSHGNLSAGKLTRGNIKPVNAINADFGNISIGEANWVTITASNCPLVNLGMVQAAVITSRFSRITAVMANSLVCDSKSDMFSIESVNNVVLQSSYTSFVTGDLRGQMVAETNYGSVVIGELSKDFSLVDLKSLQTPVAINVHNDASFTADMSFTGSAIDIPFESNPSLRRQSVNGMTKISGLWGNKPAKNSMVRINAHGGSIQVNGLK